MRSPPTTKVHTVPYTLQLLVVSLFFFTTTTTTFASYVVCLGHIQPSERCVCLSLLSARSYRPPPCTPFHTTDDRKSRLCRHISTAPTVLYDSPTVNKIHLSRSISGSCQEVVRDRSILPKVCTPLEPDTNGAGTDNQHSTSAVVNQSVPKSVRQAVSQAVRQSVTRLVHSRDQPATI